MAESLRKGNKVFVEGRFRTREFEGRDGQKRTALEITADSIVNLERRPRGDEEGSFAGGGAGPAAPQGGGQFGGGSGPQTSPSRQPDPGDFDDLPF
jgi:single-strand DNA-binding protein